MTQIGSVYGQAIYELASSENLSDELLSQVSVLKEAFSAQPDFIKLLSSPVLSKQERCGILDDSFKGKIHVYLLNFLKILTEKNLVKYFIDCCDRYVFLYNADHGILTVKARTAVPMSLSQRDMLRQKLSEITGKQIVLHNIVDSSCLGGVRLDYDGQRLDGTIKYNLDSIRDILHDTVL